MRHLTRLALLSATVLAGCGGGGDAAVAGQATQLARPECDPNNGGLTLPEGFCAVVVHEGVGSARHIAVTPDGAVYVALRDQRDEPGGVVGLRDSNGDGLLDQSVRFGDVGGTGMEVQDGYLYFAPNTMVLRYRLPEGGELAPTTGPDTIVTGLPEQRGHAAKSLALDGAGNLWVNIGGPSNACQEPDRQPGVPGQDPCPQLDRQGGVWHFDANRVGQRQEDGTRWATGIRNAVALAHDPVSGGLYALQHGRDQLDMWPGFTPEDNAERPAEEFLRLEQGDNFGWPYCFYDRLQDRRVLSPEYGGDGQEAARCAQFKDPLVAFPGHWAPNDLLFYTGSHFPERYRGGAFIAFHGSWNRGDQQQGYRVVFQPMSSGQPAGEWETFADGFAGQGPIRSSGDAEFRPMGLAQAPDGSLLIVDSQKGRIWRVMASGSD